MTTGPLKQLRERLLAALAADDIPLGTATLPGGATAPALVIGTWEDGTTVQGLEVIVARTPNQQSLDAFEFVGFLSAHTVRLINWSGTEDLEAATNAIAAEFWPLDQDPRVIEQTDRNPEQVVFAITP